MILHFDDNSSADIWLEYESDKEFEYLQSQLDEDGRVSFKIEGFEIVKIQED
jgi:hypothetical protein